MRLHWVGCEAVAHQFESHPAQPREIFKGSKSPPPKIQPTDTPKSGVQRFERYIWRGQHDLEQRSSRASWVAAVLFPVLERLDADTHQLRKLALRQTDLLSYSFDVWRRYLKPAGGGSFAAGNCLGFFQALHLVIKQGLFHCHSSFTSSRSKAISLSVSVSFFVFG